MAKRIAMAGLWLLGACSDGRAVSDLIGVECAQQQCAPGQVCCIGCSGHGTCLAPGADCPAEPCSAPPDGGVVLGAACGAGTCLPDQSCCIDCDGTGQCLAASAACVGFACSPNVCGDKTCDPDDTCCSTCPGPRYYCAPPGSDCPRIDDCG